MARNNLDIYENILILIVGTLCFYVLRNSWRKLSKKFKWEKISQHTCFTSHLRNVFWLTIEKRTMTLLTSIDIILAITQ